jgi:hypothetical protein
LKAIEKNYYIGWPGLTTKRVRKYLLPSGHTSKGHLHMVRQGIKSTKKPGPVQGEPKGEPIKSPRAKEHEVGVFTMNTTELEKEAPIGTSLKNLIATDLPGRYPVTSRRGNKYIFVLYDYDSNLIIAEPIKSRNASDLVNGFDTCFKALTKNGCFRCRLKNGSSTILCFPQIFFASSRSRMRFAVTYPGIRSCCADAVLLYEYYPEHQ